MLCFEVVVVISFGILELGGIFYESKRTMMDAVCVCVLACSIDASVQTHVLLLTRRMNTREDLQGIK